MGSLVSPIVANLYMENFEKKALCTASTLRHWLRFVYDTFVMQQESHKEVLLDHVNNLDPAIKFIVEGNQVNGTFSFLDTLVKLETDNSLSISVYRKPTHTNQYLQWDSHHNLAAKYSIISTLTHRAKVVCTGPELLNKELQHLGEALSECKYPIADPFQIRGQARVVHPIGVPNPETNEEIEEEVDDQITLPSPRWNYREMMIDPMLMISWLKCILELACCKFKKQQFPVFREPC